MKITVEWSGKTHRADLSRPIDISIPLVQGENGVNCFYAPLFETHPVVAGDFIGSTAQGGPLNFLNIRLNPHGNGTHTECVGHIAKEPYTINQCLKQFFFPAQVISVLPIKQENGDRVIEAQQLNDLIHPDCPALVIRTIPNISDKLSRQYSGTNPPFFHYSTIEYLVEKGIDHLLTDLPSVDREEDGGALAGHKAFWNYYPDKAIREQATISELVYVPDTVPDGIYLLNIQIASFELDVSPSKPILFELEAT